MFAIIAFFTLVLFTSSFDIFSAAPPRKIIEKSLEIDKEHLSQKEAVDLRAILRSQGEKTHDAPFLKAYPGFFQGIALKAQDNLESVMIISFSQLCERNGINEVFEPVMNALRGDQVDSLPLQQRQFVFFILWTKLWERKETILNNTAVLDFLELASGDDLAYFGKIAQTDSDQLHRFLREVSQTLPTQKIEISFRDKGHKKSARTHQRLSLKLADKRDIDRTQFWKKLTAGGYRAPDPEESPDAEAIPYQETPLDEGYGSVDAQQEAAGPAKKKAYDPDFIPGMHKQQSQKSSKTRKKGKR